MTAATERAPRRHTSRHNTCNVLTLRGVLPAGKATRPPPRGVGRAAARAGTVHPAQRRPRYGTSENPRAYRPRPATARTRSRRSLVPIVNGGEARARVILAFATVYLIWGSTYLAIRFAI